MCFSSVYEVWISDKEQMKLCYVFHLFVGHEFLTKNRWILLYVFNLFMGVWISGKEWMDFMICFSSIYGAWISDKEQMNFIVCFLSVYGSVNFWHRMDEFYGMFFIYLWSMWSPW